MSEENRRTVDFSQPCGMGFFRDGVTQLSPAEAYEAARSLGAVIVDLRAEFETNYRIFGVPEVIYIPRRQFIEDHRLLPRDRPLILTDSIGLWSNNAIQVLRKEGYSNLAGLIGGVVDWEKDGLPLRKDGDYELRGQCSCRLKPRIGGSPLEEMTKGKP